MNGYFPRDQDGNPLVVDSGNDDGSITIGYIQDKKRKAIKVWEKTDPARTAQYAAAADILGRSPSRFFIPYKFREKALLLEQQQLDILITDWINHDSLKDYISRCLGRPERLLIIADAYARMQMELQQTLDQYYFGPESIIVTSDAQLLIGDYKFREANHSGNKSGFRYDGYASTLCTYISIKAFSEKPHLWDRYLLSTRDELLFNRVDLADVKHSAIYLSLKGTSVEIDGLLEMLVNYCDNEIKTDWLSVAATRHTTKQPSSSNQKIASPPREMELAAAIIESTPVCAPADKKLIVLTDPSLEEPLSFSATEFKPADTSNPVDHPTAETSSIPIISTKRESDKTIIVLTDPSLDEPLPLSITELNQADARNATDHQIPEISSVTVDSNKTEPDKKIFTITDSSFEEPLLLGWQEELQSRKKQKLIEIPIAAPQPDVAQRTKSKQKRKHKKNIRLNLNLYKVAACAVLVVVGGYFLKDKFFGDHIAVTEQNAVVANIQGAVLETPVSKTPQTSQKPNVTKKITDTIKHTSLSVGKKVQVLPAQQMVAKSSSKQERNEVRSHKEVPELSASAYVAPNQRRSGQYYISKTPQ
ncbi:hypothetical protein DN068_20195 [Taibaiella soli]|uniref:Uncharacterized protein n=2 Tax=Taibaiella soli TaxID=1649169 RepID=A0A2W2BBK4_9BACT|nr:hypothetical protein DN068_20195 [Taibaiella soli]